MRLHNDLDVWILAWGSSINDVSSKLGQKCRNLLSKKTTKGREGGHKIGKMGRRRLWMAPCYNAASSRLCYCLLLDKVGKIWNLKPSKALKNRTILGKFYLALHGVEKCKDSITLEKWQTEKKVG